MPRVEKRSSKFGAGEAVEETEVEIEVGFRGPPAFESSVPAFPHGIASGAIGAQAADRVEQAFFVVVNEPALGILDHFGKRAEIAGDGGCFACESLDEDQAEGLVSERRHDNRRGMAIESAEFGL